jgi:hypothetical protein
MSLKQHTTHLTTQSGRFVQVRHLLHLLRQHKPKRFLIFAHDLIKGMLNGA